MTRAATRDASFYRRPDVHSAKVYHVVRPEGFAMCGRLLYDDTVDAATVHPDQRCQRPGCKGRWPDYDLARTYVEVPPTPGVPVGAGRPCPLCDAPPGHEHASSCPRSPTDPMQVRRTAGVLGTSQPEEKKHG